MAASVVTEKDLRIFATDRPELNTLVDNVRFSSEDIEKATINVVDRYNVLPPAGPIYTIETFPSQYLLTLGTWGWLLKGAAIGEASNHFEYNSGGVQINDRNKATIFADLGKMFWDEFMEASKEIKVTRSINQCYGNISSEYAWRFF